MKPFPVDATDAFDHLTITVKFRNLWRVRLGMFLLRLAARCLRCDVKVNDVEIASHDRG